MKKGMRILLDLDVHDKIERIQIAEKTKFSYIDRRKKEDITADLVKLGAKEFVKLHNLEI